MASLAELLSGLSRESTWCSSTARMIDDRLLIRNVGRDLAEALPRADGLVVVATPEHTSAIARHLVEEGSAAALRGVQDQYG
jgi:hypothetical protein